MVINIDSKEFCDILNFVRKCEFIDDIKFEIDPIINDAIKITISKYHRGIGYRHSKVLDVRDLISGTFGISEAIKGIIRSMERDLSNYIEKENKHDKNIPKKMVRLLRSEGIIRSTERDLSNYIEKENKHDKN